MFMIRTKIQAFFHRRFDRFVHRIVFSPDAQESLGRKQLLYSAFKALKFNGIDGDYVEFGCCGGMTFAMAYHEAQRHKHPAKFWAFDSFQGLPAPKESQDAHPQWVENAMATSLEQFHQLCASRDIPRDAYAVVPGFYDQSLPALGDTQQPTNIALAYIDCDLYSSTKDVLQFLLPRLKHGMILAFDDYFCWSASQISGERLAFLDLLADHPDWDFLPYIQFGWHGQSFVVEHKRRGSAGAIPAKTATAVSNASASPSKL